MIKWTEIEVGMEIGPYRVEALLGQGGMARVYRVWHTGLHRHEALKLLKPQMTFDKHFVERFLAEARTAAGLTFINIGMLYNVSPPDAEVPYFTMELIRGGDLSDLLHRRGRLTMEEAIPLLTQIAAGLDYAHGRHIIHRDVKPANILLDGSGPDPVVKIVDFGIARAQESEATRLTKTGMIVGTPEYMSPEQAGAKGPDGEPIPVSERSDQYSLAIIAYEMLCGQTPFPASAGDNPTAILMGHIREAPPDPLTFVPDLTTRARDALIKALAKNPQERFATCSAFVAAFEYPSRLRKTSLEPSSLMTRSSDPSPVRFRIIVIAVAVIAVLVRIAQVADARYKALGSGASVKSFRAGPPALPKSSVAGSNPEAAARSRDAAAKAAAYLAVVKDQVEGLKRASRDNADPSDEAAQARKAIKNATLALAASDMAIQLDPANADAHAQRYHALRYLDRPHEAGREKRTAEKLFPGNPEIQRLGSSN